jgi:hypothetical protein
VDVGHLKPKNFMSSDNKLGYAYLLTPKAISEKAQIIQQFLKIKLDEHEGLGKKLMY